MATRIPPHHEEAEKSVIGAILIDKEAINTASEILKPEDFYNNVHEVIFDAMITLFEARNPIDIVTLQTTLKKKKQNKIVDISYITELVNSVPTAANVEHYARIIKEASTKRNLIHISAVLSEMCFDPEKE
ncbi:MAG TPA: DnaB-like helicase N-terminal domain-containing protein, partial [Candidatus Saccharimonadales bacterium]|nr:DnaB-like helicase N-terminal domain-containing protein [Candidatus Saccharimonadales bacterium]